METIIEVLIDISGSMGTMKETTGKNKYLLPDGTTRLSLVKQILQIEILPALDYASKVTIRTFRSIVEKPNTPVIQLLYTGPFDFPGITKTLNTLSDDTPQGGTPITNAIEESVISLKKFPANDRKIILLTDGHETGGGDFKEASKKALDLAGIPCKIFIVGIAQDPEAEKQSKELSLLTNGSYVNIAAKNYNVESVKRSLAPLKREVLQDTLNKISASTVQEERRSSLIVQPVLQSIETKLETLKQEDPLSAISKLEDLENRLKEQISNSQRLLSEFSSLKELMRNSPLLEGNITSSTMSIDEEYSEHIRQASEMFLYKYLCVKHGPEKVRWLNENIESLKPHDFELIDDKGEINTIIECKGTPKGKPTFYLTANEWIHFLNNREIYQLYRVFNVASEMRVECLTNLYSSLISGAVVPYLLKPELVKEGRVFLTII